MDTVSQDIIHARGSYFVGRSIVTNHQQMLARMLHMNGRGVLLPSFVKEFDRPKGHGEMTHFLILSLAATTATF